MISHGRSKSYLDFFRIFEAVKKIISIFLAGIILFGSAGITLSTHYCMGRAVESRIMIGHHDLTCGMPDLDTECDPTRDTQGFMAPGCCDDAHFSIDIRDDYEKTGSHVTFRKSNLFAFIYTFIFGYSQHDNTTQFASIIYPPPLEQNFLALYQSYLL